MEKIVKNDGNGLVELLGLHKGTLKLRGYYFTATNEEGELDIYAELTDESKENIKVCRVFINNQPYYFCDKCGALEHESTLHHEIHTGYICYACQIELQKSGVDAVYDDWP